ncbi:MAG: diheme cytochrome c [Aquabacterium sp.]|nr:diheme cytochrome c [Aquabacterium sp.]
MTTPLTIHRAGLLLALLAGAALTAPARADNLAAPQLPAYQQECAACHLAYPPGLLPAASWQRLMANLPKHFGTDASLDAPTLKTLSAFLAANAGSLKKVARDPSPPPDDRISQSAWFVREHREIDRATWQRKAIGSPSNCAACHTGAAQGRFSEQDLRIPK